MIFNYTLLGVILVVGLITSYQDFRERKIRNKWILLGLFSGLAVYSLLIISYFSDQNLLNFLVVEEVASAFPMYLGRVFLNGLIALIFGYILWKFDLWAAGDGKLFALFSFLLPLQYYWRTTLPVFPSFVLMVNIFTPLLLFLILENIFSLFTKIIKRKKSVSFSLKSVKEKLGQRGINLISFLAFFSFFHLLFFQISNKFLINNYWRLLSLILIMIAYQLSNKFLNIIELTVVSLVGIFFYYQGVQFGFLKDLSAEMFSLLPIMAIFMTTFIIMRELAAISSKKKEKRYMPFAFFALLGVALTVIFQGSLISMLF